VSSGPGFVFDGLEWLLATANTCHPYQALLSAPGGYKLKMRNIGSAASPLNVGSANATGNVIIQSSSSVQLIKLDHIYTTDLRSNFFGFTASDGAYFNGILSNVWGAAADDVSLVFKNMAYRGLFATINTTNNHGQPGGHFSDGFTSTTAGVIQVTAAARLAELPSSAALTVTGGTPLATVSTHYMPAVDDQITWKFPYKVRGYTAFNGAPTLNLGTATNFLIEVSIDYGATWVKAKGTDGSTDLGTIDISTSYAEGFPLWVRATTKVSSSPTTTTHGLGRIFFAMTTTATAYVTQYPLEEITFTDSRSDGVADASVAWVDPGGASLFGFYTGTGTEVLYSNEDGTEKTGTYISRRAGYGEFVGGWTETTSWYLDTKVYFIAQTLIEAVVTTTNDTDFTHVDGVSIALGADKTLKNLYDQAQYYSCLEGQMLYDIPVVSGGNGAYTANVDVIVTGWTLNGPGSLAMGSNTLTSDDAFTYTYTGGTFSQATTSPTFSGGTLNIGAAGTYTFTQAASMTVSATPTAPSNYVLSAATFTGTLNFRNTSAHNITVEIPSGVTANSTGSPGAGTVTFVAPVVTADISITGMSNTTGANNRLQIINTTAESAADWQAATAYAAGDIVLRTSGIGSENTAGLYMRCTTAGTSGASEPTWDTTVGNTTTDGAGTLVWTTYAILYYDADPAATSLTDTYIDGEEFLAGETVEIRFAEEDPAVSLKTYSTSVAATAEGFSALVNEEEDSSYATYATSGITQDSIFSPNFVSNYIVLDADTNFTGSGAYAYYCYLLTTSEGMYRFWGGLTGIDPGNIRNNTSVVSLYFDCSSGFVRQTDDVRIFRSDGLRPALDPVTASGGGIEINWKVPVNVVSTGGSALTPTESAQLMALPSASTTATAVGARTVEGTYSEDEILRLLAAALAGKREGIGTATETYTGLDGVTTRISLTPDASGNGTPVLDVT
jgi:hypothetical protein